MSYITYRIKVDLIKYLAISSSTSQTIDFSITNNENFVTTYESAYGLRFTKTSSLSTTTATIYAGGGSSTKTGNDVLDISATHDYVIFDGTFEDTSLNTFLFFVIKGVFVLDVDGKTNLILYKQNSENDYLSKSLTFVDIISGKFNTAIGLKNIDIDVKNYSLNYNYVYIPKLNRYYYVDSIELITADYTRLHLKEDVLMTWKDLIKSQSAFITRYAGSTNTKLVDERLPLNDEVEVVYYLPTMRTSNFINVTLNFNLTGYYNIMVDSIADYSVATSKTAVTPPSGSVLPTISDLIGNNEHLTFITKTTYDLLCIASRNDDATASYINNIIWYPFDPTTAFGLGASATQPVYAGNKFLFNTNPPATRFVEIGSHTPDVFGKECSLSASPYLIIADFNFTPSDYGILGDFRDYEPNTLWEFYIPFVGWISVSLKHILSKNILIYYALDLTTGSATAFIYNNTNHKVIWSGTCQMGIKLSLTTSNALEIRKIQQSNELNLAVSLLGTIPSLAQGVAGDYEKLGKAGVGVAKSIAGWVNANRMLIERGHTILGGGDNPLHAPTGVYIRKSTHTKISSIDDASYLHLQGKPYNNYVANMLLLSGYVEVGEIHFDPKANDIYQDEISEIIQLLQGGIIF